MAIVEGGGACSGGGDDGDDVIMSSFVSKLLVAAAKMRQFKHILVKCHWCPYKRENLMNKWTKKNPMGPESRKLSDAGRDTRHS